MWPTNPAAAVTNLFRLLAGGYLLLQFWDDHLEWVRRQKEEGIVFRRCVQNGTMALTFDDGPNIRDNATERVLDALKAEGIRATFFVNGDNYFHIDEEEVRVVLRRIVAEGHYFGSHGWSHKNLTDSDNATTLHEMVRMSDALLEVVGRRPTTMRPAYGEYDDRVLEIVNGQLGLKVIMWSINTADWRHPRNVSASLAKYSKALEGADPASTPGHIVLHHDTLAGAPELALAAIEYVQGMGWRLVDLAECLGLN